MANVMDKYSETISEMKADVEASVKATEGVYLKKHNARQELESQLKLAKEKKKEHYRQFFKVVKQLFVFTLKSWFNDYVDRDKLIEIIQPVNGYIKYEDMIDEIEDRLSKARVEAFHAECAMHNATDLLEKVKSIESSCSLSG